MWKVRMYMNTGLNLINVVDSEETLNYMASRYKDFPAIDVIQRYFLNSISIRAFEDDVIQGDFIKLWDESDESRFAFYTINGFTMTSGDVVELDVTMEPLLTCGGIDSIDFLDGMTSRHHLADGEADPTEDDPLLIPQKITTVACGEFCGVKNKTHQGTNKLILVSNYNLADQIIDVEAGAKLNVTENSITGDLITTPIINKASDTYETDIIIDDDDYTQLKNGTAYHMLSTGTSGEGASLRDRIMLNIKKLIEYGRQDVILDAYYLPTCFAKPAMGEFAAGLVTSVRNYRYNDSEAIVGKKSDAYFRPDVAEVKPIRLYTYKPNNTRVFIGKHFAYTFIVRDSGEKTTVNPEDIMIEDSAGDRSLPGIGVRLDARPSGNVKYYIKTRNRIGLDVELDVQYDELNLPPVSVSSKGWDKADIIIRASNGLALAANSYGLKSNLATEQVENELSFNANNINRGWRAANMFNDISAGIQNSYRNKNKSDMYDQAIRDLGRSEAMYVESKARSAAGNEYDKARYERANQRKQEDLEFLQASIPKVNVLSSGSGNTVMDTAGLLVYRSLISEDDLRRFDRILTQFGCKKTEPVNKTMLHNRQVFDYLETSGVSIKCDTVPKSVREELAIAFNSGLRIWHNGNGKIDSTKYTEKNGPVPKQEVKEV